MGIQTQNELAHNNLKISAYCLYVYPANPIQASTSLDQHNTTTLDMIKGKCIKHFKIAIFRFQNNSNTVQLMLPKIHLTTSMPLMDTPTTAITTLNNQKTTTRYEGEKRKQI